MLPSIILPFSWPAGGSMIVDFSTSAASCPRRADPGPGEKIVVGPIDLAALRTERQRRAGAIISLSHLRTEAYNSNSTLGPSFARADGQREMQIRPRGGLCVLHCIILC